MTRHIVYALLVVLLALPASSWAGAREDLAEATKMLENVEEEKAIPLLLKAIERGDATATQRAEMWALVAVARFNLRDELGSRQAFRKALDADSSVSISKLLPPKGWSVFEQARIDRERELADAKARAAKDQPLLVAPPPPVKVEAKAEAGLSTRKIAGIAVGVAGVVGLGAGIGLMANASSLHDKAAAETEAMKADDLYRSGSTQRTAGIGVLAVGAAAAVAGVILIALPEGKAATTVMVGPSGVAVAGQF